MTQLEFLGLDSNGFDPSPIPFDIGNLQKLTWLGLARLELYGPLPSSLFTLRQLTYVQT